MKRKLYTGNEPGWWERKSEHLLFAMIPLGLACFFGGISFFHGGKFLSGLGLLLLGAGLMAVCISSLLDIYRDLTDKGLCWATVVNRLGCMVLGPAIVLIAAPWEDIAKGSLTQGQCILLCTAFCGFSLLPAGWSLAKLIMKHHGEGQDTEKDPWE